MSTPKLKTIIKRSVIDSTAMITFAERLKNLMEEFKIPSRAELARRAGWAHGNQSARIGNYLEGTRTPEKADATCLAKVFGLTFEELIEGTDYKHAILIEKSPIKSRIPLVEWNEIPAIIKNPEVLKSKKEHIRMSFMQAPDIFAARIPDPVIPGESGGLFNPRDHLLISLTILPQHNLPVIISENNSEHPVPEYAIYIIELGTPYLKLKGDRYIKYTPDITICGVVVARINIFIKQNETEIK